MLDGLDRLSDTATPAVSVEGAPYDTDWPVRLAVS